MNPSQYFVYILVCANGSLYVGQTHDIHQRMRRHADGTAAAFTREHPPLKLMYLESVPTRAAAVSRERQIKGWTRAKKEALIEGDREQLRQLSRRRSTAIIAT